MLQISCFSWSTANEKDLTKIVWENDFCIESLQKSHLSIVGHNIFLPQIRQEYFLASFSKSLLVVSCKKKCFLQ